MEMDDEAAPQAATFEVVREEQQIGKTTYKSYKKKYRKMQVEFTKSSQLSNELHKAEYDAERTLRRLNIETAQLKELLLDVNSSAQIPNHLRFDLTIKAPSMPSMDPIQSLLDEIDSSMRETPQKNQIYKNLHESLMARSVSKQATKPTKSLAELIDLVPHRHFSKNDNPISYDLGSVTGLSSGHTTNFDFSDPDNQPLTYMTPQFIDEYLAEIDVEDDVALLPGQQQPKPRVLLSDKELYIRNPHSAYNWLRRHKPEIFLQDGEPAEKASGKPGALRGAGKRASIPVPTKIESLEFVEEDGQPTPVESAAFVSILGNGRETVKGKRKRTTDDDSGYRPKGGGKRPYKRKKPLESTQAKEPKGINGETGKKVSKGKSGVKIEVGSEVDDMEAD